MRKVFSIGVLLIMTGGATAIAQEQPAAEKQLDDQPAASSTTMSTVNDPVKSAAADVQHEMNVKPAEGGYGSAGCGLGTLIFEPNNDFTQIFAATTNGTFGTQTFGITSGTSNCDGAGYNPGSAAAFVETNRSALAKDISRGRGATIASLSDLAGCRDAGSVGLTLKKNFKTIFPSASASDKQVSKTVLRVLRKNQSLGCKSLA